MSWFKLIAYGLVLLYAVVGLTFLYQNRDKLVREDPRLLARGN